MITLAFLLRLPVPGFIKLRGLNELFRLTADAFGSERPELRGLSFADCLSRYALFTQQQSEAVLESRRPVAEVKHRLYQNARSFGQSLRKNLQITTWEGAIALLEAIYKLIGIDLQCSTQGEITVRQCYFSQYYSARVCELISSLDEGLAAGLSGGGKLCFTQRITQGCCCCKGSLHRGPIR